MKLMGIFLLLLVSAECFLADETDSSTCPEHWVDASLTGLGCLLFNSTKAYGWEEANNYCQRDENASLVEIWTSIQLDFIRTELILLYHNGIHNSWWTSGTDLSREGEWYWGPSGTSVGDFVWGPNEPHGNTYNNCLKLYSTTFFGRDNACTSAYLPICQKK